LKCIEKCYINNLKNKEDSEELYLELLKLKRNPDQFFQKINDEINSKELDLTKLDLDNINEEDQQLLEEILKADEEINELNKSIMCKSQNLENEKSFFLQTVTKLIGFVDKNNIEAVIDLLVDNQQVQKVLLKNLLSRIKTDKIESMTKFHGFLNEEWGKVLFLAEIISRLSNIKKDNFNIFPLGSSSYFIVNGNTVILPDKEAKLDKYKPVFVEFFKILEILDPESHFEGVLSIQDFTKKFLAIITTFSNIIEKL
jgi:hypothetical protein